MATIIDPSDDVRYEVVQVKNYKGTPLSVTTDPGYDNKPTSLDAFGRLRTSTPYTLFDSQHRYQENDKWSTSLSGSGTTAYQINESAVNLAVTTASGDKVVRESKRVFPYQPGKSLLIMSTFVMAAPKTNLRQRVGYFSTQNGVFLEQSGTQLYLVLRSYVTGAVVETRVAQNDWNVDTFNGSGASGRTLDVTKSQILWADIEWLGVGDVRIGFNVDGILRTAHVFHNDNEKTTTYMTTAILPLRYEIENTGTTATASTMKQICSTVASEGGYEGLSKRYSIDLGSTAKTLVVASTSYPILSIRLNSSRLDSVIVPSNINGIVVSNTDVQYQIILNPTLTGASWTTHYNGNVDYDTSATATTSGTPIVSGYIKSDGQIDLAGLNDFNFQLGRTLAGVSDVLSLVMTPTQNNTKILAGLSWYEVV